MMSAFITTSLAQRVESRAGLDFHGQRIMRFKGSVSISREDGFSD
jgi:hypothetical protein